MIKDNFHQFCIKAYVVATLWKSLSQGCSFEYPQYVFYGESSNMSCVMRNRLFAYAKTKAQISTVTMQLISLFVFTT